MASTRARAILTAPARGLKAVSRAVFGYQGTSWGFGSVFGGGLRGLTQRKVGNGRDNTIVQGAVGWLQRNVSQARLRVMEPSGDGDTLTPILAGTKGAGRMLTLLRKPNPFYNWKALAKASAASTVLDGEFFWLIVGNNHGAPTQIYWIPNELIEPIRRPGSEEFIDYYAYRPNGVEIPLRIEDVVHHRDGIDPENPMRGFPRVRAALREVMTDEEASLYTSTLLQNMGVPGLIVSPEAGPAGAAMGTPSDPELKDTKAKVEQATSGANRGRPLVFRAPTKVQAFGFNPQQMSLKELRRVPEERVTAAIGVPAIVAGMGAGLERSTFSNFTEAREAAVEEALIPLWDDIAMTIWEQLLPLFDSRWEQLEVDFDLSTVRVLREDQDKLSERVRGEMKDGLITLGEGREKLGYGVDESHDVYLRPLNVIEVPVGQTIADVRGSAEHDDGDDEEPDPDPDPNDEGPDGGAKARAANMDGAMVALFLDAKAAEAVAIEGGEAPEQLHVTLALLEEPDTVDRGELEAVVVKAARPHLPLSGQLNGHGVFHGPDADVRWAAVDVPGLAELRHDIVQALDDAGFKLKNDHGFTPHVTLLYDSERTAEPPTVEGIDVTFREVFVAFGEDRTALKRRRTKRLSVEQQRAVILALEADQKEHIPAFARDLEGAFVDLGKHAASLWAEHGAKHRPSGGTKADEDEAVTTLEVAAVERTIELAELEAWQKRTMGPVYHRHYDAVARKTIRTLVGNLGIEIAEPDTIAIAVIEDGGKKIPFVDVKAQTQAAMLEAIADGKAAGEGPPAIERRIRQYVTDGSSGSNVSARAMRIAREETMSAQRLSTRLTYQASGAVSTLVAWDNRVGFNDPDCVARNGRDFTFDEAPQQEAQEHINGTLSWAPGDLTG